MMYTAAGVMFIFVPDRMKKVYSGFLDSMRRLSFIPLIFGLLFLWAAPASSLDWLMRILGVMGIIKGISMLVFPRMMQSTLNWWLRLPSKTYRIIGIFVLLLAWVVISSIL